MVEKRHTAKADMTYWLNTCPHCRSIQGDFYLHEDRPGAFYGPQFRPLQYTTHRIDKPIEMMAAFNQAYCPYPMTWNDKYRVTNWQSEDDAELKNPFEHTVVRYINGVSQNRLLVQSQIAQFSMSFRNLLGYVQNTDPYIDGLIQASQVEDDDIEAVRQFFDSIDFTLPDDLLALYEIILGVPNGLVRKEPFFYRAIPPEPNDTAWSHGTLEHAWYDHGRETDILVLGTNGFHTLSLNRSGFIAIEPWSDDNQPPELDAFRYSISDILSTYMTTAKSNLITARK